MFTKYKHKVRDLFTLINSSEESIKYYLIYVIIFSLLVFLVVGLFNLQILKGKSNLLAATRTSQDISLVLPLRGSIYDVNGEILAYNAPSYSLYIDKTKIQVQNERELMKEIAKVLGSDSEELLSIYRQGAYEKENIKKIKLISGLDSDKYFKLIEKVSELEGVDIESEAQRRYKDSNYFSSLLGYVGKPSEDELGDDIYSISIIGKTGIEKIYDSYLRGKIGKNILQKEYGGSIEKTFQQDSTEEGDNVYLTIDEKWQKNLTDIMQQSLEDLNIFASSAVIMNSDTGEIKAMVSLPNYDNNLFISGIKTEQYEKLIHDEKTPLLNRAIGLQLPSGSVFKVVGATAGLETGVISKHTVIRSEGCMQLSAGVEFCEADKKVLGDLTVATALSKSSNLFFCKVAMKLNSEADGIETVVSYAKKYGLGQETGVDLVGEQKGMLPSPELKKKLLDEGWYIGDDCNTIIGQGLLTVTPIQMAVVVSAINNGGLVLRPHLLDKIADNKNNIIEEGKYEVVRELGVSEATLDTIKEGMRLAAKDGSGSLLGSLSGDIMVKTGSADASEMISGKLYSGAHSWIIGCFDDNEQHYCFVVIQQWGGRGYRTVPVIKKFINCVQKNFSPKCQEID